MAAVERWMPGGLRVQVLLTGEDTGGAFCLLADEPPPGWGLPTPGTGCTTFVVMDVTLTPGGGHDFHKHPDQDEMIIIKSGRVTQWLEEDHRELGPGDVAHVPAGVRHSGGTLGDQPGRRVVVFTPAGAERIFLEAGSATPDEAPDLERLVELAAEHGWSFGEE